MFVVGEEVKVGTRFCAFNQSEAARVFFSSRDTLSEHVKMHVQGLYTQL